MDNAYVEWLRDQGISTVLLIVLSFGIYRGVRWLSINFLIPLRDAAVQHLKTVDEHLTRQTETMRGQTDALKDLQKDVREAHDQHGELLLKISMKLHGNGP